MSSVPVLNPQQNNKASRAVRVRLVIAAIAFFGWLGYLAYTVSQNGHVPVISRAQITAAKLIVVAEVTIDSQGLPEEKVQVNKMISGKEISGKIQINNLPKAIAAGDYRTPVAGLYVIPLVPVSDQEFAVADLPATPARTIPKPLRPTIYPWNDDVKKQLRSLGFKVD
jgi:hypothetical protein